MHNFRHGDRFKLKLESNLNGVRRIEMVIVAITKTNVNDESRSADTKTNVSVKKNQTIMQPIDSDTTK